MWKFSQACTFLASVSFNNLIQFLVTQEKFLDFKLPELAQLTGIAAILRFPMPELEDSDEEGGDGDDSDAE